MAAVPPPLPVAEKLAAVSASNWRAVLSRYGEKMRSTLEKAAEDGAVVDVEAKMVGWSKGGVARCY
jgi:hypothetical protein